MNEIEEWMKHNNQQIIEKIDFQLFDQLNKKYQCQNQHLTVKKEQNN